LLATHQIVIYESTNVIEVYIQNKPLCTTWNSGNAVIGIQNAAGSSGICPPGRNTGQWTASNEAWRFTPNGTPNYSITWWQGTTQIGTTATITVSPTTTTTYTAQVVYDCCAGNQVTLTDSVNVIVNGSINLTINPTNPTICAGDSSTLTALSNNPAATFQWSTGASGTSINVNPITNTTYTVTATTPGCTDQTSVTVAVTPVPIITVNDTTICGLQTLTLKASGATTYLWSTGNTNSSIIISPTATTTYTVTGTDSGCTGSASGVVTVNPLPVANAGNDQIVCQGRNVTLTASGGTSYQWSNGVAQNIPFTQSVTTATTYTVTVSNSYDCTATDTVIVTGKLCNITVPNVFTPNGDGYNDFFVIKGLEDYPNTIVQIFNRWGKNVYESTNYQNDWDGKSLSDGIYFFVITFIDYHDPMTGTVMIFRKN
jgi:gliding motility-associated-like protein